VPAIKGAVYTLIYITFSQPELTKLYNENIGGHRCTFTQLMNVQFWYMKCMKFKIHVFNRTVIRFTLQNST